MWWFVRSMNEPPRMSNPGVWCVQGVRQTTTNKSNNHKRCSWWFVCSANEPPSTHNLALCKCKWYIGRFSAGPGPTKRTSMLSLFSSEPRFQARISYISDFESHTEGSQPLISWGYISDHVREFCKRVRRFLRKNVRRLAWSARALTTWNAYEDNFVRPHKMHKSGAGGVQ